MSVTTTRADLEALADAVAVEQCDRDEAHSVMQRIRGFGVELGDAHLVVQAFARHRARAQEQL